MPPVPSAWFSHGSLPPSLAHRSAYNSYPWGTQWLVALLAGESVAYGSGDGTADGTLTPDAELMDKVGRWVGERVIQSFVLCAERAMCIVHFLRTQTKRLQGPTGLVTLEQRRRIRTETLVVTACFIAAFAGSIGFIAHQIRALAFHKMVVHAPDSEDEVSVRGRA